MRGLGARGAGGVASRNRGNNTGAAAALKPELPADEEDHEEKAPPNCPAEVEGAGGRNVGIPQELTEEECREPDDEGKGVSRVGVLRESAVVLLPLRFRRPSAHVEPRSIPCPGRGF